MIKSISIKNWKAFDDEKIVFLDGVNFLVGRNAIGKTSVLEAICLAITGEALTVDDPRKLVRDSSSKPAKIIVELLYNLRKYRIERVISKDRRISSKVHSNGELNAQGWDQVTNYLEELWGFDKSFFERVVYMSEGDIFRFLTSRSDKASILAQVEEALAIDKLSNLTDEVQKQKDCFQNLEEEKRRQLQYFSELLPSKKFEVEKLKIQKMKINQKIESLDVTVNRLEVNIRKQEQELGNIHDAFKKLVSIGENIDDLVDIILFKKEFLSEIQKTRLTLEKNLEKVVQQINPKITEKGTIEEHILSINKILDLLSIVKKQTKSDVPCPVCGKPLLSAEVEGLEKKFLAQKQSVQHCLNELIANTESLKDTRNGYTEKLDRLKVAETKTQLIYELLKKESLSDEMLNDKRKKLKNQLSDLFNERQKVIQQRQLFQKEVYDLDRFYELSQQTHKFGTKEDIEASIVGTSKALLLLDLIDKTSELMIEWERQSKLQPVYATIANVWNNMKGETGYKIELDDTATPILMKNGSRFELSQLSGGEKTSLLIIIRTVLSRKFAPIGFMLLDEPLEHLDSQNRQMVIDFLVESFDNGWVDQLIVSTFEESLLRKYITHNKVNLVAL